MGPSSQGENPACGNTDAGPFVSENGVVLSEFADSHISIDSDETEHEPHVIPIDQKEISWKQNRISSIVICASCEQSLVYTPTGKTF